jgi:sterol desaturase/sphingolipid hydroxylase (fatty acid hydroxylase superfamily)
MNWIGAALAVAGLVFATAAVSVADEVSAKADRSLPYSLETPVPRELESRFVRAVTFDLTPAPALGAPSLGAAAFTALALFAIVMLRYALFAGGAYLLCYRWMRERWRFRKIQPRIPDAMDLRAEFGWSLCSGLVFALAGAVIFHAWKAGLTCMYNEVSQRGWAYLFASVGLVMLLHETYFYWTHRWLHRPWVFRRLHRVHHLSTNPSPWAAFAFHPAEAVLQAAFLPLVVLLVPLHIGAFLAYLMIMTVLSVVNHLGYELYPAGFEQHRLGRWLISSTHHNLHHSRTHLNYGLYFRVWDRLMGTDSSSVSGSMPRKARIRPRLSASSPSMRLQLPASSANTRPDSSAAQR